MAYHKSFIHGFCAGAADERDNDLGAWVAVQRRSMLREARTLADGERDGMKLAFEAGF